MRSPFLPAALFFLLLASCASAPGVPPETLAAEYYNLGNAYFQLKKYQEAAEYYQKALAYDGSNTQAVYNLARALVEQGKWTEASGRLEELKGRDQDNLLILRTMAYLKYVEGKKEEALGIYERVLEAGGADGDTLRNAGLLAWELEDRVKAAAHLEAYKKSGGTDAAALARLAEVYLAEGRDREGAELLEVQKTYLSENPESALRLGQAWIRLKLYDKALETYGVLHEADQKKQTKRPQVWFEAGSLVWTELQDPNKALEYFRRALDQGFEDSEALKSLLEKPDLIRRETVVQLFKDRGLPKEKTDAAP